MPASWSTFKISDIADVVTGGTPNTKKPEYWGGDIRWMASGEVNKKYIYDTDKRITEEGVKSSNATVLPKGSVMIALAGQGKTRGMSALLKTSTTCNQSLAAILPKDSYVSEYLYHNLDSRYSEIRALSGGEGRSGLNLKLVKNISVDLPPYKDQVKIASILTLADNEIAATQVVIDKAKILKKALMNELLTTTNNTLSLNELVKELNTGVSVRAGDRPIANPGEKGVLKISAVTYLSFDPSKNKLVDQDQIPRLTRPVKKNTLLVSRANTPSLVGACVYIDRDYPDIYLPDKLWELTLKKEVSPRWLTYVLQKLFTDGVPGSLATGTSSSMRNISQNKYLALRISIIPLHMQERIVGILGAIDEKIAFYAAMKTKQEMLKRGLMRDLLTGKVKV